MVWEFIIGAGVGFVAGYYLAKYTAYKNLDLSQKSVLLQSLTTQVTEMKAKFDAYEKLREEKEKGSKKLDDEREKRYKEFMDSTKKFFEALDTVRKESEQKRDTQMEKFSGLMSAFNRTIHGTKTRGNVGEDIVKQYLSESIKAKLVKASLKTDSGDVEFAWNLGDGKYIPIDSKLPDIMDLINSITDESTQLEKNNAKKQIFAKLSKEVDRVKKYQNQSNTINKCILVVPESALELCPEIIEFGGQRNVIVCSPQQVFLMGYIISEEYNKMKGEGDVGQLKETNKSLITIIKEILGLTDTIEKQAKSVIKHNELIQDKVHDALRMK